MLSSVRRLLRQRTAAFFSEEHGPERLDHEHDILMHWESFSGCADHDGQGGIKKGLDPLTTKENLKGLYVGIESLRNTFFHLHANVKPFLTRRTSFDRVDIDDAEEKLWWELMRVPEKWIDDYIKAGIRYTDDIVHVRQSLSDDVEAMDLISSVFIHAMRWRKFVLVRFATVGTSTGNIVRTLSCGLDGSVEETRNAGKVTGYHAHGWDLMTPECRLIAAVAAVSRRPVEAVLKDIMKDDRVARNHDELLAEHAKELEKLNKYMVEGRGC